MEGVSAVVDTATFFAVLCGTLSNFGCVRAHVDVCVRTPLQSARVSHMSGYGLVHVQM